MSTALKFSIHGLLQGTTDGNISGAMSPLLFAQEMARELEFKFNRLARLSMDDERIHQHYEENSLTGHDTLIIGCKYKSDLWLSLWVDTGMNGIPVAMCYQSDKELSLTPIYSKTEFAKKLSKEEITEVFEFVFKNPETIDINKQEKQKS